MLQDRTLELLNYLFPPLEQLKKRTKAPFDVLDVVLRNLVIFGSQGSGKTELARRLCEEAVKKYGARNVTCLLVKDPSIESVEENLTSKLVQIIFFDDATLASMEREELRSLFRLRHVWREVTGRSNGLVLTMFGTHRFHGLLPEFRTNVDVIFWRSVPMNPYDVSICRGFIGDDGVEALIDIERKRSNEYWKSVSVFNSKFMKGICYFPLASKNYFKVVEDTTAEILLKWERALGLRR